MIVYCPFGTCGQIRELLGFSFVHNLITGEPYTEYEWLPCTRPGCRGAFITLVTDDEGFVIHPRHIKGYYVFKRPTKNE